MIAQPLTGAPPHGLIGSPEWLAPLLDQVARAARSDLPVLIVGETGTGKELIAQAVHRCSGRVGPMVPVNVAAISPQLVEAELCGTHRGAYTGALDRAGFIEAAARGTLFLDEACALPPAAQRALLRVLEHRRVCRVGGRTERPVDFRLVLAIQQEPRVLLRDHQWRDDFWHRVNTCLLRLPPLRARGADVPLLVNHVLHQLGRPALPVDDLAQALAGYDWPGNVRELIQVVHRAVLVASAEGFTAETIRNHLDVDDQAEEDDRDTYEQALQRAARAAIQRALARAGDNTTAAAASLGLSVHQLYRRIRALGLRASKAPRFCDFR